MFARVKHLAALAIFALPLPLAPAVADDENARLNAFLNEIHDARVARWPEWQTSLGFKTNMEEWSDRSDAKMIEEQEITVRDLTRLRREFDPDRLDPEARLSYRLFERNAEQKIATFPYRHYRYPVTHLRGPHITIPDLLTNKHVIGGRRDADAYIGRLLGVGRVMDQTIAQLALSADEGVIPPSFIFPRLFSYIDGFLTGVPFDPDATEDSLLLADFRKKLARLSLPDREAPRFIADATAALSNVVKPAYLRLRAALVALQARATDDAGIWKFPNGTAYYALALRNATTTDLTPNEIHEYGLSEVARIHGEMRTIATTLGFDGDLVALFDFARHDPSNFYTNDDKGREACLSDAKIFATVIEGELERTFSLRRGATLEIRRVEPYREKTTATGFYNAPSKRAGRPGTVYLNLFDMSRIPKSHLEALVYHEGVPGHHLQYARSQRVNGIPKFRRYLRNMAYTEGWGLYAERLAKEMGFYKTPMSDFGRLAWELLRAVRLVVDTGIHHKRWSREQAIAYMDETLPTTHEANVELVERYIVWPAQATAYKIGMREILALRESAKQRLGDRFNLRDFHRVVLGNGALPLDLLREEVERWVAAGGG